MTKNLLISATAVALFMGAAAGSNLAVAGEMSREVSNAQQYLEAIRKSRPDDGQALKVALEMLDAALAKQEESLIDSSTTVTRSAEAKRMPTTRSVPVERPSAEEQWQATERTHRRMEFGQGVGPEKSLSVPQLQEARDLIAQALAAIDDKPSSVGVESTLNEIGKILK